MQVSARILGQEYGLTAEEMNRVLVKLGFLEGNPGNYNMTDKALEFGVEKNFHRGTGGYACYNRYWTTRTFDDSIMDVLDVSPELVGEVRCELAESRAARRAAQAAARAQANADYLAKQAADEVTAEAAEKTALEVEALLEDLKRAGRVGLIIGGLIALGYGIYRITPKIKAWWDGRKREAEETQHGAA